MGNSFSVQNNNSLLMFNKMCARIKLLLVVRGEKMKNSVKMIVSFMLMISLMFSNIMFVSALDENTNNEVTTQNETTDDGVEIEEVEGKVNYVAIEQPYLKTPETQKIAVSFGEDIEAADAKIVLESEQKTITVPLKEKKDNLYLFEQDFNDEDTGIYTVTHFKYLQGGKYKSVLLDKEDIHPVFGVNEKHDEYKDEAVTYSDDQINSDDSMVVCQSTNATDTAKQIEDSLDELSLARGKQGKAIVVLDPGHDAGHTGASGNGVREEVATLKIARYCKQELEKYAGVEVYLTRGEACPYPETVGQKSGNIADIKKRVEWAKSINADIFVSIHLNSGRSAAQGVEVYYQNGSSEGQNLAQKIQNELVGLGIHNRGIKANNSYAVITSSTKQGFPGIIVEHAFVSNSSDASKYLNSDSKLQNLGIADATGIANYLNLKIDNAVQYQTHVQTYGWQKPAYNGETAGTTGQGKRLEAITLSLLNTKYTGGIQYRTHVQTYGWQGWKSNGQMSGTSGEAKRLEAIQIQLTGDMASHYDVYYRVHAQHFGWLDWAKNGQSAGTAGYGYRLEAIQVKFVEKGQNAPGSTSTPFHQTYVGYRTHVQTYGWQGRVYDGDVSGTTGQAKRLEGIEVSLQNQQYNGGIQYRTHVQTYGWENGWKSNGAMSGTSGQAKRLEAIQIQLTGDMANHYDVYYRVHAQKFGWLGWAKNGESAGSAGYGYRLEGIQIVLVAKGGSAPGSTANSFHQK